MPSVFAERRRQVLQKLDSAVLVAFAAPVALRNGDVEHEYRQNSDLFYLSGFDEPESALLLDTAAEAPFTLFLRPRDPDREVWDGPRCGLEGAVAELGADVAHPIDTLRSRLIDSFRGKRTIFFALGRDRAADELVISALSAARETARRSGSFPTQLIDPGTILHEMRLCKSSHEIQCVQRAVEVTEHGYAALLPRVCPGVFEFELEAVLRAEFRTRGAERCAYVPIVASGPNATTLHHRRNDRRLQSDELLLIDAGAEVDYYAADVSRTLPTTGRFSDWQRRAYDIVLRAQQRAISATRPGQTLERIHAEAVEELSRGLLELGVLSGSLDSVIEQGLYKKYYMHQTSHWLGMDVHDVGTYVRDGQPRLLEPGMLLTVEPGLYFQPTDPAVPEGLRGVGIRIEDDVLVTEEGRSNLTAAIPKLPEHIEALMNPDSRRGP